MFLRVESKDSGASAGGEGAVDGARSFSAGFELNGDVEQGNLLFFSPLGTQLARLAWAPSSATMTAQGETRRYDRLEDMLLQATGADIPVAALLAWLRGQDFAQAGWQVDLGQYTNGKIQARRVSPLPRLDLRIALDR
jgi:outer membrane lipoprotein LolB